MNTVLELEVYKTTTVFLTEHITKYDYIGTKVVHQLQQKSLPICCSCTYLIQYLRADHGKLSGWASICTCTFEILISMFKHFSSASSYYNNLKSLIRFVNTIYSIVGSFLIFPFSSQQLLHCNKNIV